MLTIIVLLIVLLAILIFELYLTVKMNREVNADIEELDFDTSEAEKVLHERITTLERKIARMEAEENE